VCRTVVVAMGLQPVKGGCYWPKVSLKLERGLCVMRFPMIILCSLIYLGSGTVSCFCLPVGHHCSLGLPWAVLDVPYVHDTVNMS